MIGVAVHQEYRETAAEFFELFKTPWEFYRDDGIYDVLLCAGEGVSTDSARLVLIYSAAKTLFDAGNGVQVKAREEGATFLYRGNILPTYGDTATFPGGGPSPLKDIPTGEPGVISSGKVLRVGYDLFEEVRFLLTHGQPAANAAMPALELHIALLRDLITGSGIPLVEIPPVPGGHKFMVCLTHDLDHPVMRNHFCDHTMFGFVYRATVQSFLDVVYGRKSVKNLIRNVAATLKLPFIYLGIASDFWNRFDRYLDLESGLGATYFVLPEKGNAGKPLNGKGGGKRASGYQPEDIKPQLAKIASAGREIGLHGIDAWNNSSKASAERQKVLQTTGTTGTGVRMHWLFFDEKSPAVLEQAGFSYDSTFGYNETVGFRAGTAQAFKPLAASKLLELPLVVMDTALFYPDYLGLSEANAARTVRDVTGNVTRFGGALTINWHDRSVAPERLWDGFYSEMLGELKLKGAWFPNAGQAVSWFQKRRSAVVQAECNGDGNFKIRASAGSDRELPGLRVRVHQPRTGMMSVCDESPGFVDLDLKDTLETTIKFERFGN